MPEPKWRRRSEDRPGEIVSAARKVFAEKGFAAARLDDIAAKAGVSKGALYLYFNTKEDIFAAVVRDAVSPNVEAILSLIAGHKGPVEPLLRGLAGRMADLASQPDIGAVAKMVIAESGNFPELARIWHGGVVGPALQAISQLIETGQASGELRPGDPRAYAVSLMAPVLMAILFRETFVPIGAKPFDIPGLVQQHLDAFASGFVLTQTPK